MAANLVNKPVFTAVRGTYTYGQVIATKGSRVTIATSGGPVSVTASKVEEIAPIVCLLLQEANLKSRGNSADAMRDAHINILDRVLGLDDTPAVRDIAAVLDGIVDKPNQPSRSDVRTWTDLATGEVMKFRLGHAIDFAHYIDGGHAVPRRVVLGNSFSDDPKYRSARSAHGSGEANNTSVAANQSVAASVVADMPSNPSLSALLDEIDMDEAHDTPSPLTPGGDLQAELVEALASKPHLLALYVQQCLASGQSRKRRAEDEIETHRPHSTARTSTITSPSDLVPVGEAHDRHQSKNTFNPSAAQRAVFAAVVSPAYAGTHPSLFIELTLSSPATAFEPHPAIPIRAFGFQFGNRGRLSVAHFKRFNRQMQRRWRRETRVNTNNHSASVDLPDAEPVRTMTDLQERLAVLHVFAVEFYNAATVDLIAAALQFCIWLSTLGEWQAENVEEFTFWFDSVLEEWRTSSETLARTGVDNRHQVRSRISRSDPDFLIMLLSMQSARVPTPSLPRPPQRPDREQHRGGPRGNVPEQRRARLAPEVIKALPRKDGKSICLKFLSAAGCSSTSPTQCEFPRRGHFAVEHLDPVVRRHIETNMGGVRADLAQA